jgi:hypothetical protein
MSAQAQEAPTIPNSTIPTNSTSLKVYSDKSGKLTEAQKQLVSEHYAYALRCVWTEEK